MKAYCVFYFDADACAIYREYHLAESAAEAVDKLLAPDGEPDESVRAAYAVDAEELAAERLALLEFASEEQQ